MCGIYGFIGKPTKKTAKAIRHLGILNEARGTDSSGLAVINKHGISMLKKTMAAEEFFNIPLTQQLVQSCIRENYLVAIGHTRAATRGAVTEPNAHPYAIGKYIFAHNGVINNFDELQEEYATEYEVDSQIIGHLLNLHKEKEVFNDKLQGMFAVPYVHRDNINVLNIAKGSSPLSFFVVKGSEAVYFSSDSKHLKEAMEKSKIKGSLATPTNPKLYRFNWVSGRVHISKEKITPKRYVWTSAHSTASYKGAWRNEYSEPYASGYDDFEYDERYMSHESYIALPKLPAQTGPKTLYDYMNEEPILKHATDEELQVVGYYLELSNQQETPDQRLFWIDRIYDYIDEITDRVVADWEMREYEKEQEAEQLKELVQDAQDNVVDIARPLFRGFNPMKK
jgi:asparagine synthetase B (glutamine-hydrolysing)